jgi:cyclomaltodextrinase
MPRHVPRLAALACGICVLSIGALLATAAPAVEVTFACQAPGAGAVHLAGSFNDWNPTATAMTDADGDGTWEATLDLQPGRHQYKFVVDGQWREDPAAAEQVDDGFGGKNSVVQVGADGVAAPARPRPAGQAGGGPVDQVFRFAPEGSPGSVYLAGEFNNWNPSAQRMTDDDGDGVYTTTVQLAPGRYQYKFVVDGTWFHDPDNPESVDDGYGGQNSVIQVGAGGGAAPAPAKPAAPATAAGGGKVAVTFSYAAGAGAREVYLAGEFNGWNATGRRLEGPDGDGVFTTVVELVPGQYQYKFVVDGTWHQDPANPLGTDDGFGGQNSVVKVKAGVAEMNAAESEAAAGGAGGGAGGAAVGDATGMRSVEFRYTPVISGVQNVFLAGTFNDWNDAQTRMTDPDRDGTYTTTLLLAPGTYQYKFVVDGQWQQDPNNPEGTDDGFGGQNSVLVVDASFPTIDIGLGDGRIYTDDIEPILDYSTCNPLSATEIELTARAHIGDVERVDLVFRIDGGADFEREMEPAEHDPAFRYYRTRVTLPSADTALEWAIRYRDADATAWLGAAGITEEWPEAMFRYTAATHPPFLTPEWAKDGIIYQIFPERFANGDRTNDPDFSEPMYAGATELPASGKTNGEYFHLVEDWYDWAGLVQSPYRTDGRPDYYSFNGGDIAGVRQHLDYLSDLGITVIYFNPLNQGMSNHKYDPTDYLTIDPHFATADGFKAFVQDCHARGIRIIVDMAFNHTGNWHFAFRDAVEKGRDSQYWNWYEFKRWPLPDSRDFKAADYYDCWWGFGLHPNLNWDLSRPNADENNVEDVAQAEPNQAVVDYVLSVADRWLGEFDIDGFRLDVPNEVPFWFWRMFRERCDRVKPDSYLVGEIWGSAGRWIGPDCFDATMNYKYFRDPVMDFFGTGRIDAAAFDTRLAPGRFEYPPQAVAVQMNLIDSHDTIRFLTSSGDVRRLMLAALFSMTYVGMPHIWYGDEIGMQGGKDPDCRRPFDWRYEGDPRKVALRDYYGTITRFRRDHPVLSRGSFEPLHAAGKVYAFARVLDGEVAVAAFNAGPTAAEITLDEATLAPVLAGADGKKLTVIVGPESFPRTEGGTDLAAGRKVDFGKRSVTLKLPAMSAALLKN